MDKTFFEYLLRLGDTSLILSQRLGAWTGHGPILEEDLALTNTALDLLGPVSYTHLDVYKRQRPYQCRTHTPSSVFVLHGFPG